jgi:cysteine synthase B
MVTGIPPSERKQGEYLPKIFDPSRVDQTIDVSERESMEVARKLAVEEAIFGGMSSGGVFYTDFLF